MNQDSQAPLWADADIKKIRRDIPMGSFGERLQRERELRSITLDEIANSTKIGTRMLHALEAEEFDKLPGGIFNKGFVRAYAKYLGIDEEQAVTDYLAAETEQEGRRRAPADPQEDKQTQPQLFAIPGGARPDNVYNIRASTEVVEEQPADHANGFLVAAVILVFLLGIGVFAWKYFNSHSASHTASTAPALAIAPQRVVTTPSQAPIAQQQNATDTSTALPVANPADSASTSEPALGPVNTPAPPTLAASDTPLSSPTITQSAAAAFSLDLRADDQSWAQVTADGKQLWSGIMDKDSSKSFRATKELIVKLGNAPGVQLAFNGKPLPKFSDDGKTRTLTFTPEGLSPR